MICNAGLAVCATLLAGTTNDVCDYGAIGTNGAAPAPGDVGLGAEVYRNVIVGYSTDDADYSVTFEQFWDTTEANGNTIRECGMFFDAAGVPMLCREVVADFAKTVDKQIIIMTKVKVYRK